MLGTVLIALIILAVLFYVPGSIARRRAAWAAYVRASEEFYSLASNLPDRDSISSETIEFIDFLNKTIADKTTARKLFGFVCDAANLSCGSSGKEPNRNAFLSDSGLTYEERREIIGLLKKAVGAWFRAVLNHSPIYGKFCVAKMAESMADDGAVAPAWQAARHYWGSHSGRSGASAHAVTG